MGTLRKRGLAWFLSKGTSRYERMVAARKAKLFSGLDGRVIEIGAGTGPNLRYFPSSLDYLALEPNQFMHPHLRRELAANEIQGRIEATRGEEALQALPAGSADFVVATLVLCSVANPSEMLRAIHRALRPGGRLLFLEHVGAPRGSALCLCQVLATPLFRVLGDGCRPTRDTKAALQQSPFARLEIEEFRLPVGPVAPHICGYAEKDTGQ